MAHLLSMEGAILSGMFQNNNSPILFYISPASNSQFHLDIATDENT